ncbi:hypothetical protein HYV21_00850 [Candidatus Microgenomates bacterium]|nr:hypothetical protein [Candidatus Microgenomates bacterium]
MSKKFIAGVVGILFLVASAVFLFRTQNRGGIALINNLGEGTTEVAISGQSTYEDGSGFSFAYPDNVTVTEKTIPDDSYYSLLELSASQKEGKVTVTVQDTSASTLDEWFESDPDSPKLARVTGAASLGEVAAKQYAYSRGAQNIITTLAVDLGVLYRIEGPQDGGFWEEVQNMVVSSFAVAPPTAPSSQTNGAIYEEEEEVY